MESSSDHTHVVKVYNHMTSKGGHVGRAWQKEDGSISLVLNPCVVLQSHEHLTFHLFPADASNLKAAARKRRARNSGNRSE